MKKIFETLRAEVKKDICIGNASAPLQDVLFASSKAIQDKMSGDGAGLSGGVIVDKCVGEMLAKYSSRIKPHHKGEADLTIGVDKVSFKNINGKSNIALDWSKNPNDIGRDRFVHPIVILQLKKGKWWQDGPKNGRKPDIFYNKVVEPGFYVVDNQWCKDNIKLKSNNKTDSLIDTINVYEMIQKSISDKTCITLNTKLEATWNTISGITIK